MSAEFVRRNWLLMFIGVVDAFFVGFTVVGWWLFVTLSKPRSRAYGLMVNIWLAWTVIVAVIVVYSIVVIWLELRARRKSRQDRPRLGRITPWRDVVLTMAFLAWLGVDFWRFSQVLWVSIPTVLLCLPLYIGCRKVINRFTGRPKTQIETRISS